MSPDQEGPTVYNKQTCDPRKTFAIGDSYPAHPWPKSVETAAPFKYGSLIPPFDFRVLIVKGAESADDPIECILTHQESSIAQYQALSYTWGTGSNTRQILINGGCLPITDNLHAALRDIRNEGDCSKESIIWADGICINQEDFEERAAQVKIMPEIYQRAIQTVVWIGPATGETGKAINLIDKLSKYSELPKIQALLAKAEVSLDDFDSTVLADSCGLAHQDNWNDLATFFSYPWFERMWILQEVALSSHAIVMYGGRTAHWKDVALAAIWMDRLHWSRSMHAQALQIEAFRQSHQLKLGLPLLELLIQTRNCKASDPLDKIFALHGILKFSADVGFIEEFSYLQTPKSLYLNITLNMIQIYKNLDVLHLADNEPKFPPGWQSFVPDLSRGHSGRQMGRRKARGPEGCEYHAARETEPKFRVDDFFTLGGILVDEVKSVGLEMVKGEPLHISLENWVTVALNGLQGPTRSLHGVDKQESTQPEEIKEGAEYSDESTRVLSEVFQISPLSSYPSGCTLAEAFWRTLIRNTDTTGVPPSNSIVSSHFKPWIRGVCIGWNNNALTNHLHDRDEVRRIAAFDVLVRRGSAGSRIFKTNKNYTGTGSRYTRPGDLICILYGGQAPFILRRDGGEYLLISDCYVHGLMEGEGLDMGLEETEFKII